MLLSLSIAAALLVVTTAIHAGFMMRVMHLVQHHKKSRRWNWVHSFVVSRVIVLMFGASLLEALLWAGAYLYLGALDGFEEAAYFSMVTYTTLGYGEIVLSEDFRLLSSFEAANGIIMFGWTTAIIIAAVQRIYFGTGTNVMNHPHPRR